MNKALPLAKKYRLGPFILAFAIAVAVLLQLGFVSNLAASIPQVCLHTSDTTLDSRMQSIAQASLASNIESTNATSGTVLIMDANTGAIRSLIGLENQNGQLSDSVAVCNLFGQNGALSPWEPGSVIKPLLFGAALDKKTINPHTTYYETGRTVVGERIIENAETFDSTTLGIQDIITRSLNTGAVFVLRTLGNGDINQQARDTWYDYLTNHYRFTLPTSLGIAGEPAGYIRKPSGGPGLELRYAQMSFGLGLTLTPIQLASAYAALVNGGTYYQPYIYSKRAPKVVESRVVTPPTSAEARNLLQVSLRVNNPSALRQGFVLGAKSGTAPSSTQNGTYEATLSNGTYVGFIGKDMPSYIILVRVMGPHVNGLASAQARIAWTNVTNELVSQGLVE